MAFTRVKPAGWATGEILTSTQMNTLDTDHENSIDGAAGGTYANSGAINVQAFTCTTLATSGNCTLGNAGGDAHTVNGTLTAVNAVTCQSTLAVTGAATFDGNVTLGNAGADTITCNGALTCNSSASFGLAQFANTVTITSAGSILSSGPIAFAAGGRLRHRVLTVASDANATFQPGDYTMVIVPAGLLTAGRTFTLGTTGVASGDSIQFWNRDGSNAISVTSGAGTKPLRSDVAFDNWGYFVYDGTNWHCVMSGNTD